MDLSKINTTDFNPMNATAINIQNHNDFWAANSYSTQTFNDKNKNRYGKNLSKLWQNDEML